VFAQTKAKVTEIDLIGAVYAAAPREYIVVLTIWSWNIFKK